MTGARKIVVVDDEVDMADSVRMLLTRAGYEVVVCNESEQAPELIERQRPDLVITDLLMPGLDGLQLLDAVRARQPDIPFIVLTGFASVDSAVAAMKKGVADYLAKPFAHEELLIRIDKALSYRRLAEENRTLRERAAGASRHGDMIGRSAAVAEIERLVAKVAATDACVLLVGETGTGKELVARLIHRGGPRARGPFFAVDCGAFAGAGLEAELFGCERGAVAGAEARAGLLEAADGGTLFLDDICETTPSLQTRLLQLLQEGQLMRVGGTRRIRADVRLVASSNGDPRCYVADRRLSEELYYRLSVVRIAVPPLRERAEDVPLLVSHFTALYSQRIKKRVAGVDPEAMAALERHAWPGNIRELENVIERAIIMVDDGDEVGPEHLPPELFEPEARASGSMQEVRDAERDLILRTLRECGGNRSLAARKLGIGRRTLYDKVTRLGISLRAS